MKHFVSPFVAAVAFAICLAGAHWLRSAEPINAPRPMADSYQPDSAAGMAGDEVIFDETSHPGVHIFPAVLTRRYGPVEEPAPEFYALRNTDEPGFDWSAGLNGWGTFGWGGLGYGFAFPGYRYAYPGFFGAYPSYGFNLAGYNSGFYRPWYTYPSSRIWSDRLPWYAPGGVGPNIYQPWYLQRYIVPWYLPYGIGPNIYTPNYIWRSNYPWYAPSGPGPNIYTPSWQYGGCLYW